MSKTEIAERVGVSRPTAIDWREGQTGHEPSSDHIQLTDMAEPEWLPPTFWTPALIASGLEWRTRNAGKRVKYSPEFEEEAAKLVVESSRAIAEVARRCVTTLSTR